MRHLSLGEVLELHRRVVEATGGATGVRDLGALESALEALLMLNGAELQVAVDDAEHTILDVAAGRLKREAFVEWVRSHVRPSR